MKTIFRQTQNLSARIKIPFVSQRACWTTVSLAALLCGSPAPGQTNAPPGPGNSTLSTNVPAGSNNSTNVTKLEDVTVFGKLDVARSQISPDLGATAYTINKAQITSLSQGANAPFNQVILRAPGVAQDSAANGDLHVRGEHANLQYRINDVLLPEGISGFGLELDPRFVDSLQLVTGSLPAQYGFRTAGVVDIRTKSGAFDQGGEGSIYGGSYDTIRPSFEYGGSSGKLNYFIDGGYDHNALGIENPTSSTDAIHDKTDQGKMFSYLSYVLDDTSRVSLMLSGSYSDFQVPNQPGLPPGMAPGPGTPQWLPGTFDSSQLNETQNEQNYFVIATYQKSAGNLDFQISALGRNSSVHFMPDPTGDLFFNGVASDVDRKLNSGGLQADGSYNLNDQHTIRAGMSFVGEFVTADSTTTVFPVDAAGNPTGPAFPVVDNNNLHGLFTGMYLQDEWKIFSKLTLNAGARFDIFNSSFDNESQISPRANLIYQPVDATTLHAGYARYFTPPPVEDISGTDLAKFTGTSNDQGLQDSPVKAERADYFDAGISQRLAPGLTVGVDGYYKKAKNQLDDGLFGQSLILSAFNYERGIVKGVELTGSYIKGGFSSYANFAISQAEGKTINSSQFLFDAFTLNYAQNNWIYLDHDQTLSGSFGVSYLWKQDRGSTLFSADALYGSGLRMDSVDAAGDTTVPNGSTVPNYYSINFGIQHAFKIGNKERIKIRFDVVNVTDNSYELRDGSGIGVNAPQFGARRGYFGTLSYVF